MDTQKTVTYKLQFQSGDLDKKLKELNKDIETLSKSQKNLKKANKETSSTYAEQKQKLKDARAEYRQISQAISNTNKLRKSEIGYMEKLKAKLSLVTLDINKLRKGEQLESKEGRKLIRIRKQLNDELSRFENKGGTFYRSVGNYANGLKNLWSKFKLFFGLALLTRLFSNFITTIKDFEQGSARLAAVLGTTKNNIKDLTKLARELGATTQYTATEVLGLAESLAKLGFNNQDIKNMTKDVLNLATALDTDLGSAATLAGSTIRAFDLKTTDSAHVMDVLAKSTTITSLSFSKLETALPIVGTVAKNAGVSLETLVSQLGALTDRGIDASTAGTSLRKIYLQLAKSGLTLEEALDKIRNSSDKNKESLNLFGIRAATAGVILSQSTDKVNEFDKALQDADGTTKAMAEERLDTLSGSLKLVSSAWNEFLISMSETGGIGDKLKVTLQFIAANFKEIMRWLAIAITGFASYKLAVIAQTVATNAYIAVTKIAKITTIGFSATLKAIPWAAVISAISMFIVYLTTMGKKEKEAVDYTKSFVSSLAEVQGPMNKLFDAIKDTNKSVDERKKLIKQLNDTYKDYLPNLLTEKSTIDEITTAQKFANDALYQNILMKSKSQELDKIYTQGQNEQIDAMTKVIEKSGTMTEAQTQQFKKLAEDYKKAHKDMADYAEKTGNKSLANISNKLVDLGQGFKIDKSHIIQYAKGLKIIEDGVNKINGAYSKLEKNKKVTDKINTGNTDNTGGGVAAAKRASEQQYNQAKVALEKYRLLYHTELNKQTDLLQAQADDLIQIKNTEYQKELDVLKAKSDLDLKNLKNQFNAGKITLQKYTEDKYKIEEKYQIDVEKLKYEHEDDVDAINKKALATIKKQSLKKLNLEEQYQKAAAKQQLMSGKIDQTKYAEELKSIEIRILREKIAQELVDEGQKFDLIEQLKQKKIELSTLKAFNAQQKAYQQQLAQGIINQTQYNQKMSDLEISSLKKSYEYKKATVEEQERMIANIKSKWLKTTTKQEIQQKQEVGKKLLDLSVQYASQAISIMDQMRADADAREMEALQTKHDDELNMLQQKNSREQVELEKAYASGQIVEEQYVKGKLELEQSIANREKRLKDKQAEEDKNRQREALEEHKKYQRAAIVMNTAQAVIGTWAGYADMGAPGAIIAAIQTAMILGLSAMELEQVNSQTLAEGGIIDGPLHRQGGVQVGNANVEGGEYVINRASTQTYKPVLDYINSQGNGTNNTADMKPLIDYTRLGAEIAKQISNVKVILTEDDLVKNENNRVLIEQNSTF